MKMDFPANISTLALFRVSKRNLKCDSSLVDLFFPSENKTIFFFTKDQIFPFLKFMF